MEGRPLVPVLAAAAGAAVGAAACYYYVRHDECHRGHSSEPPSSPKEFVVSVNQIKFAAKHLAKHYYGTGFMRPSYE